MKARARAWTIGELVELLLTFDQSQKIVFTEERLGDFDVVGNVGSRLSEDNFVNDLRPILRLQKRLD